MPYLSPALNVMTTAARKAGRKLTRDFGEVENLQISFKGPADFVTAADQRTERMLVEELSKARPGYNFLVEEQGVIEGPDKSHLLHHRSARRHDQLPPRHSTHFAISIALEREGQLVSAVIHNPVTDEMYTAEKGHGAYLNDKRLRVANRKQLKESLFATGIPFLGKDGHEDFLRELSTIMGLCSGVRRFGSAALDLAYVAAGRYDGFWERGLRLAWGHRRRNPDRAREAGGMVSDLAGGARALETGDILAANETIHPQLLKLLKRAG